MFPAPETNMVFYEVKHTLTLREGLAKMEIKLNYKHMHKISSSDQFLCCSIQCGLQGSKEEGLEGKVQKVPPASAPQMYKFKMQSRQCSF